jgi:hypothetical protein
VGANLFHADEQTDMTNLIVALHNFANAPKKKGLNITHAKLGTAEVILKSKV